MSLLSSYNEAHFYLHTLTVCLLYNDKAHFYLDTKYLNLITTHTTFLYPHLKVTMHTVVSTVELAGGSVGSIQRQAASGSWEKQWMQGGKQPPGIWK